MSVEEMKSTIRGVHEAMMKNDVEKLLGTPLHDEERQDGKVWVWWWHGNPKFDSLFSVTFEQDKAVKIILSEDTSL